MTQALYAHMNKKKKRAASKKLGHQDFVCSDIGHWWPILPERGYNLAQGSFCQSRAMPNEGHGFESLAINIPSG
jgi:hypothetical protein